MAAEHDEAAADPALLSCSYCLAFHSHLFYLWEWNSDTCRGSASGAAWHMQDEANFTPPSVTFDSVST